MSENRSAAGIVLNTALVLFGIGVLVLLYAFVTGSILSSSPAINPLEEEEVSVGFDRILQVDVRNGAGVSGIARQATQYLRGEGFDVVEAGNHSSFDVEHSMVFDRGGDMDAARHVASKLGIPEDRVQEDLRPDAYLDASVIIGHDYEALDPFKNQ